MDALLLARVQFGLTAFFHFLYPPLSIGLSAIIAVFQFCYLRTGREEYDQAVRFWFKLFSITFVVGVASGIAMEFQFGTNWSEYSKFVGDIFGAPLAAEGVFAFFLESTFMGLLLFGREKLSRGMQFFASLMVALGSILSAFWIIAANSWQQTPTAFKIEGGRAVLTDFVGAVLNPSTVPRYLHTIDACFITGALFVVGISAYFLLKQKNLKVARLSIRFALIFALIAILAQGLLGDMHARQVGLTQPAKLAAFEGQWESRTNAPLNLLGFPDPDQERTSMEIGVPGLLSWLIHRDTNAEIKGLKSFAPGDRPPVLPTYLSYKFMLAMAGWFLLLIVWGNYLLYKKRLESSRLFLWAAFYSMFLPLLVNEMGWFAAEFGRQPWAVYGLLRTSAAASPLPAYQILISICAFLVIYSGLFAAMVFFIRKAVKKAELSEHAI